MPHLVDVTIDNVQSAPNRETPHRNAPGTGTPGEDYTPTEGDRQALNAITLTVEFLMVAARALSRGFPQDHPEVAQYLTFARLKMPTGEPMGALSVA